MTKREFEKATRLLNPYCQRFEPFGYETKRRPGQPMRVAWGLTAYYNDGYQSIWYSLESVEAYVEARRAIAKAKGVQS